MTDAELDAKLTDAYAEGRKDQLEEMLDERDDLMIAFMSGYHKGKSEAVAAALAQPVQPQEPVGHLYTIAGIQHCTIEKVLPDGPLYTQPVKPVVSNQQLFDALTVNFMRPAGLDKHKARDWAEIALQTVTAISTKETTHG